MRFFHQFLEIRAFLIQAALQRPCSTVVRGRRPASRPLAREKFLHNSFDLFRESFLRQLLGQFGLQLRGDHGQEFGVVCEEGLIDVRSIEDEHVVTRRMLRNTENGIRTSSREIPNSCYRITPEWSAIPK